MEEKVVCSTCGKPFHGLTPCLKLGGEPDLRQMPYGWHDGQPFIDEQSHVWFNGLSNGLIEGSGYADLGELDQLDEEHKLIYEFSQAVSRLRTVGGNVWARDVVI